jgi:NDP-sugar pyrophosphorylase family protein
MNTDFPKLTDTPPMEHRWYQNSQNDPPIAVPTDITIGSGVQLLADVAWPTRNDVKLIKWNTQVVVGDWTKISSGAEIGSRTHIGNNCTIGGRVVIEDGVRIGACVEIEDANEEYGTVVIRRGAVIPPGWLIPRGYRSRTIVNPMGGNPARIVFVPTYK